MLWVYPHFTVSVLPHKRKQRERATRANHRASGARLRRWPRRSETTYRGQGKLSFSFENLLLDQMEPVALILRLLFEFRKLFRCKLVMDFLLFVEFGLGLHKLLGRFLERVRG